MSVRTLTLLAVVGLAAVVARPAAAQDPPAAVARRPIEIFAEAQELIGNGRFELAAENLKDLLAARPTDQDWLDIEGRYGVRAVVALQNVRRWYDDPTREAEFRKTTLAEILKASRAASEKLTTDPVRIARFVGNLSGPREEQLYAIDQLRRSREFVVPALVESLRTDQAPEQRAGVYAAVRSLGADVIPGLVTAATYLPGNLQAGLLRAIGSRPDAVELAARTDTTYLPLAWYLAGGSEGNASVARTAAVELLAALLGPGVERRRAEVELTRLAEPLLARKGQFLALDRQDQRVRVWEWDAATNNVKPAVLPPSQAEERYGLRWLRWALDRNPRYEPARSLFVALAAERAVERANYAPLATAEPAAYQLLTAVSSDTLTALLADALAENRTALAYALVQAIGDRGDKTAALASEGGNRPSVLARALTYPDPRVQLAAAVALLRAPAGTKHGANARVVEVLARAAAGAESAAGTARGKAIVADPAAVRAGEVAGLLRGIGYSTEVVGTGRDLIRRVAAASDVDLVLVDRHIVNPTLIDVLAQLRADANAGRRPVLVVASADAPRQVGLETLLVRLACLVAATETDEPTLPQSPPYDKRKSDEEIAEQRAAATADRDRALRRLYQARLARTQRLIRAADAATTPAVRERVELRIAQLTYAVLIAEFDLTERAAPTLVRDFQQVQLLFARAPDPGPSLRTAPTDRLVRILQELEQVLTPPLRDKFERLRRQVDPASLLLPTESPTDPTVEIAVRRAARVYPGATVIREPFATVGFEDDVKAAFADPAQAPRDPAEKKAAAKVAVEWLRRLAVGEVPGYDVRPAEPALRTALGADDLAPAAIDALARIPTAAAQTDLVRLALAPGRPIPLRVQAADGATLSAQANGALAKETIDPALGDPSRELRGRLLVLRTLLSGTAATDTDLLDRIKGYIPAAPTAAPVKDKEAAPEPKESDKKPEGDKDK